MLDRYEHDNRIGMISGMNIDEVTPDVSASYFFTSAFCISGWASWRRVVDQWEGDYGFLDDEETVAKLRTLCKTPTEPQARSTTRASSGLLNSSTPRWLSCPRKTR